MEGEAATQKKGYWNLPTGLGDYVDARGHKRALREATFPTARCRLPCDVADAIQDTADGMGKDACDEVAKIE